MPFFTWDFTIRTSNSSTENLPKNSRSTIYCAGSFLAKLSTPLTSYLFSTYAHRLIQYAYFSQCYRSKQMVLESFVSISTIPILVGRTAPYRYGKVWFVAGIWKDLKKFSDTKKPAQNMNFVRATGIVYLIVDSMLLNQIWIYRIVLKA